MATILVVDDDLEVLKSVSRLLTKEGYTVRTSECGHNALEQVVIERPDLIILDMIMPEMDGLQTCRYLRADPFTASIPIMFLTAKGRADDIIEGLDAGADDFLVKPFEIRVLPARVRAVLRRVTREAEHEAGQIMLGQVKLSLNALQAEIKDQVINLTPVEHQLLYYFICHPGQPAAPEQLLQTVWGYPPGTGDPGVVRVHIAHLRTKMDLPADAPQYIQNVHGKGYMMS